MDYSKILNKTVVDMKPSGIRKFFDIAATMDEVISLGVGEPDFQTPWEVRKAAISSLERGKTKYTSNRGLDDLRVEIANYLKRRCNLTYNPEDEILVTVGGSEAIDASIRALVSPGDEVIIPQPSYVCYEPITRLAGGIPVIIETKAEDNFKLTKQQLLSAITEKTKALILPFPCNPTGGIMEKEDLEEISEVLSGTDIMVISDEIYSELTFNEIGHIAPASIDGMHERTITVNGFSKSFSMTGWRLGFACGPKEIMKEVTKIHQFAIMCAPTLSQYAAVEALKNGDKDVELMKESYNERRNFLMNSFKEMGIDCFVPYGAFYVFPSIKKFNMSSDDFAMKLLDEENVAVVPGSAFGDSGEGFLRISYAYSIDNLKKAME
ncbi:MAG: aminotransferase class I/II-fold pyridoxal phosphate-dependent enzyme, partial [Clostridia bacterium]|nr:aminotransferase class I/II-fold pyridoxal phosphate-dependent enzyme [Clostridia bacterium]